MNGHKSDLRKYINGTSDKTDYSTLYAHLQDHSHGSLSFNFQILEQLKTDKTDIRDYDKLLDKKEREWIWKLDTLRPNGLNMDDGFHSQNKKSRKMH